MGMHIRVFDGIVGIEDCCMKCKRERENCVMHGPLRKNEQSLLSIDIIVLEKMKAV